MALIKCSECGREFSDKAISCPDCACPVEKMDGNLKKVKKETEEIIIESKLEKIYFYLYFGIWVAFSILCITSCFLLLLFPVFAYMAYYVYRNKKMRLVLTNKRIYGNTIINFVKEEIDIPINQVSSISVTKSVGVDTIVVETTGSRKYSLSFVANADDIRTAFTNLQK